MDDPISIIILLVVGLISLFSFLKFQEKKKKIIQNGVEVTGVIFQYDGIDIEFMGNKSSALPVIRFVTKEGLWITEKAEYALSRNILKEGQEVKVIYNEKNPKEFIYKTRYDLSKISYLLFFVGLICFIAGLWFAYKYLTSSN